ncbi:MAG: glycosyltransferase [Bacteroidota bacterium]|nr:glycosyltransferase [Bacteroidota bacterium]
MNHKHLHIISFDVPYPANYGGVIDVYYKLKALHEECVKIHLHCFEYGRAEALHLESLCEKVYYYKRKMDKTLLFDSLPFVVVTRTSEKLMENLLRDNHPILFEGLHSCFHLNDPRLSGRIRIVRTHNIEHDYYRNLRKVERSVFKRTYFGMEGRKLEKFEKVLHKADHVAAISPADASQLSSRYNNVHHITAFHPYSEVSIAEGTGKFCLYHGNLEVGENNEAALYLVNEVFSKIKVPFIVAGKKPSPELLSAIAKHPHISVQANITTAEIDTLIREAQINVLPTFQATGIKLKLLAALFNGRHCIVNSEMVLSTGLEGLCVIKNDASEMAKEIEARFHQPFDMTQKQKRAEVLGTDFSNAVNVQKLLRLF